MVRDFPLRDHEDDRHLITAGNFRLQLEIRFTPAVGGRGSVLFISHVYKCSTGIEIGVVAKCLVIQMESSLKYFKNCSRIVKNNNSSKRIFFVACFDLLMIMVAWCC